jgi:hypothetical protein
MNERILKLAVEAGVTGYFAAGTEYATPVPLSNEVQKFAESIVRECAEVGLDSVEDGDDLDAIMKRVHNNILKHFGVAE